MLVAAALFIPLVARAEPPRAVRVEMIEFAFRPAVLTVKVGQPVRLVFVNRGQLAHQFQTEYLHAVPVRVWDDSTLVDSPGLTWARVEPGGTASMEFYPQHRGRFAFACTIEGHAEAGMRGTLAVK